MEKIPFVNVIHSRSNESNAVRKKNSVYFLLAKYIPMSHKNGGQKWNGNTPSTACVGSYFIPDKNIPTYISNLFAKLQHAKAPGS